MPIDTSRWEMVDDAMAAILRQKTEGQRLAIAFGIWNRARDTVRAELTALHPKWTPEQIQQRVAQRMAAGDVDRTLMYATVETIDSLEAWASS